MSNLKTPSDTRNPMRAYASTSKLALLAMRDAREDKVRFGEGWLKHHNQCIKRIKESMVIAQTPNGVYSREGVIFGSENITA